MSLPKGMPVYFQRSVYWLRLTYTPVSLLFIVFLVYQNWDQASVAFSEIQPTDTITVVLSCALVHVFASVSYYLVVKATSHHVGISDCFRIHFSKLPARYLPGGIWHSAGKMLDLSKKGIGKRALVMIVFLEVLSVWCASLIVYFLFSGGFSTYSFVLFFFNIILLFFLFHRLHIGSLNINYILTSILAFTPVWLLYGFSIYAYLTSAGVISEVEYLKVSANYALSAFVGFLAVFAPQGIGVSEAVFLYLHNSDVPIGFGIAFLVSFRAFVLIGDVVAYICFQALRFVK